MRLASLAVLTTLALSSCLIAAPPEAERYASGKKPLTVERITADPPLVDRGPTGLAWRDATHATWVKTEGRGAEAKATLVEMDASTGQTAVLTGPLFPVAADVLGKEETGARRKALSFTGSVWSPRGDALLLSSAGDLWLFRPGSPSPVRLTRDEDEEQCPTFSPDGTKVAFVKKNDLYTLDIASLAVARISTTGGDHVLNGRLDWVYEEELAGRRNGRSYEWAPDSKGIAWIRLDENRVPTFPVVDFLPTNGKLLSQRYPKAGDPNAVPSVHAVRWTANGTVTSDVKLEKDDVYVAPDLAWTADSTSVCYLVLDRPQQKLEVNLIPAVGGTTTRTILVETDPAWINSIEPPRFLKDGTFVFASERTGFSHLYRYSAGGRFLNAVTKGDWVIDRKWEIDEASGTVWFVGTEADPRQRHVYRVNLDGTGFSRLSSGRGSHAFELAPGGRYWVHGSSAVDTLPRLELKEAGGRTVAALFVAGGEIADYRLASTEMGSFRTSDGTLLFTRLVKPADFDPAKKYPVIVYVYGGPHAQLVQDRWGATSLFDHLCAEKGFLVWTVDGRGSWGRGHAFETPILKKLGEIELKDQLEGVAWLKRQAFVDPARIGIWGWSYGGYMTLYAATHAPEVFKVAVAGAPVTDWKFYDSIYTERYMKTPKENPGGYKASSNVEAAAKLGPKLQIQHGTSDDNVHMQNTIAFIEALERARKGFEFVPLPRQKHGPREPAFRLYSNQRILDFFERNL